ncbi:MAG: hypothetical protein QXS91_03355 [Candidatus Anstonellales archaeon]
MDDGAIINAFRRFEEEGIGNIRNEVLGNKLKIEKDMSKIRHFIFSFLAAKLGGIKENFLCYTYVSRLFTDQQIEFKRVIDILKEQNYFTCARLIGDTCLVLVSFFRKRIEASPPMTVDDYMEIGQSYYLLHSKISKNPELFFKLASNFEQLAHATFEAFEVLRQGQCSK